MLPSPRSPSSTIRIFSSALYFRRMLLMVASAEGFPFPLTVLLFILVGRKSLHYLTPLICPDGSEVAHKPCATGSCGAGATEPESGIAPSPYRFTVFVLRFLVCS